MEMLTLHLNSRNKRSISLPCFFILTTIVHIVNLGETLEGSAEPENPPTLSLNDTVQTKRWLVEGSAPKNASLKVHNLQDTQNLMSLKCQKTRKKHRDASHIPVFSKLKWQIHTF